MEKNIVDMWLDLVQENVSMQKIPAQNVLSRAVVPSLHATECSVPLSCIFITAEGVYVYVLWICVTLFSPKPSVLEEGLHTRHTHSGRPLPPHHRPGAAALWLWLCPSKYLAAGYRPGIQKRKCWVHGPVFLVVERSYSRSLVGNNSPRLSTPSFS